MALLQGLTAFWKFEEVSTSAVDDTGNGHDLTWNVSGRTPPGGAPAVFSEPTYYTNGHKDRALNLNSSYIWAVAADWNRVLATSFTFAGWCKPQTFGSSNNVVLSLNGNYHLDWGGGGNRFNWTVYKDGGGSVSVSANATIDFWHSVRVWLDLENGEIGIQVDCAAPVTAAWTGALNTAVGSQTEFCFGREGQSYAYSPHIVDQWGLWTRTLATNEASLLCNDDYPWWNCGTITYGNYEFPNTFALIDDSLNWLVPMQKIARAHGGRGQTGYLQPRKLAVHGGIIGTGPIGATGDLHGSLDDLTAALAAQPQSLQSLSNRYWRNVRVSDLRNNYQQNAYCRFADQIDITFEAEDPFQYGISLNRDTWSSPVTLDTHSLNVGGNAFAVPSFDITIGGSGAQTISIALKNTTTGDSFTLVGSVTGGSTITVDCLAQTVEIGGDDSISLFDGQWLSFDVGANTLQITITTGTVTSVVTTWRSRWW